MLRNYSLLFYVCLWHPTLSMADVYDPILSEIKPGTITFIGESHKHPESVELFQNLVSDAVRDHRCVIVGLEIASDQQAILDKVMESSSSVDQIQVWPALDYENYRQMIKNLAVFKQRGHCIEVIVIDSVLDNGIDRDEWMAAKLEEHLDNHRPILVLVGAMHTLKRVNWTVTSGKPSVAELLSKKGFNIHSFPQRWIPDACVENNKRVGRFVSANSSEALSILNETLISLINADPDKSAEGVVDGFLVWECT